MGSVLFQSVHKESRSKNSPELAIHLVGCDRMSRIFNLKESSVPDCSPMYHNSLTYMRDIENNHGSTLYPLFCV